MESQTPKTMVPTVPAITNTVATRERSMNDVTRLVESVFQSETIIEVKATSAAISANAARRCSARIQSFRLTACDATVSEPRVQAAFGGRGQRGHLALVSHVGHHEWVADDEATHLILETLFDMRIKVDEIHAAVVEPEDDDEETEEDS